ncbi:MAG TPA: 30S ribosome-binding factor RbfA [Afifellaceae bacterium]|nr:30S ribosome-binding factor RbfA [Afifellaceae bacterium]
MARPSAGASAGMPSQRQLRVGELVRHALAETLGRGDVRDPDLERALITVSEVRVSADLRHAVAYVTLMGDSAPDRTVAALNRNARYLRGQISPRLRQMKYMPDLQFRLDTRFDDDSRIDSLLKSETVARDLDGTDGE